MPTDTHTKKRKTKPLVTDRPTIRMVKVTDKLKIINHIFYDRGGMLAQMLGRMDERAEHSAPEPQFQPPRNTQRCC